MWIIIAAFVWGILVPELEANSEKRTCTNKCLSRDLCVLSQTTECFGMLQKKNVWNKWDRTLPEYFRMLQSAKTISIVYMIQGPYSQSRLS